MTTLQTPQFKKPKEYPQQPETKTLHKHAMSEICFKQPIPSYSRVSRGRVKLLKGWGKTQGFF